MTHRNSRVLAALLLALSLSPFALADGSTLSRATRRMLEAGDLSGDVDTLNNLGFAGAGEREVRAALAYYRESLDEKRRRGDVDGEFRSLMGIGVLLHTLGDNHAAIEPLRQAVALAHQSGKRKEEASALHNLAVAHWALSEAETARGLYQQALTMFDEPQAEAATRNNLGLASLAIGDPQSALQELSKALRIRRELRDRRGEAHTLNNLGLLFASLGEVDRALRYHREALELRRRIGDRHAEARSLNNLGALQVSRGDISGAQARYCEALPLFREAGDRVGEAACLNNLGVAHAASGDRSAAVQHYFEALRIHRQVGDRDGEALTWFNLGVAELDRDDPDLAAASLEQSLAMAAAIGDDRGRAAALDALARLERRRGKLAHACALAEEALDIVERLRQRIFSSELRATFLASRQNTYELFIDLLMEQGLVREALQASERSRVRGIIEAIAASSATSVDAALNERLNENADRHARLVAQHKSDAATAALEAIDRLRDEILIHETSTFEQPVIVDAAQMQQQIIDRDTILLEYALGDARSWLFVVTTESVDALELPPRAQIENEIRALRNVITARNTRPRFETADERRKRIADADRRWRTAASRVADSILRPAKDLARGKRIVVVPDGAMFLLPFAALPTGGGRLLIDDHEIVVVPSASALQCVRNEAAHRKPSRGVVAVIADPVFDAADPRVRHPRPSGAGSLPRLPGTRKEAESIVALAPSGRWRQVTGFAANRASIRNGGLSGYRYVHFATHSVIDSERPELSGIVLSLVDEKGRPQAGVLRTYEIAALRLPTEMVVLSGCGTALGKEVRGEGLIGLTHAFFRAGAERLLVSLWDVDDEGTATLMHRLYRSLLAQPGRSPASALREAQLSLRKEQRWRAPYYWAAFVLNGEPTPR